MKKSSLKANKGMIIEKFPGYFLFGLIILLCFFLIEVFKPFMMVLILSAVVATVTYPIYERLNKAFRGRAVWASILTSLIVIFAIIIPITIFLLILISQLGEAYTMVKDNILKIDFDGLMSWKKGNMLYDLMGSHSEEVAVFVRSNLQTLVNGITDVTKQVSTYAAEQSLNLFKGIGLSLYNLLFMFFVLVFYYKDGKYLVKKALIISPLPEEQEQRIIRKFVEISKAALVGNFLTALSQGIVAWIGFSIAGVPSAFFWATAVSVFSLVPVVGTGLVWIPMGLSMIFSGNFFWGIFILLWGAGLIGTIDNFVRAIYIGASAKINPLLMFIAAFGGLIAFGLVGIVFGPLLLAMFLTLIDVYELEFAPMLADGVNDELIDQVVKPKKKLKIKQ
jgi:predicted PurR-regulated permease PerM